jgi:predicted regulator of Ras-like GTPase activity (Roadblock/LC7/MglB family)
VAAPAPVAVPAPAAAAAAAPVPHDIGELFGQPGRKNWSPAEVVQKTAALHGVAGAIMAMPDGLLVASHLPPGLNGEAIAAFLPQMFSRMMQYSKELKFGESNRLTVIINDVPLKIYRLAGVFFAAVGRAEEPLPDALLNLVAAHLSPQSK